MGTFGLVEGYFVEEVIAAGGDEWCFASWHFWGLPGKPVASHAAGGCVSVVLKDGRQESIHMYTYCIDLPFGVNRFFGHPSGEGCSDRGVIGLGGEEVMATKRQEKARRVEEVQQRLTGGVVTGFFFVRLRVLGNGHVAVGLGSDVTRSLIAHQAGIFLSRTVVV